MKVAWNKGISGEEYLSHYKDGKVWNKGKTGYTTSWKGGKQSEKAKQSMRSNHWSKKYPEKFRKLIVDNLPRNPSPQEEAFYEWISKFIHTIWQYKVGKYCCDFYVPELDLVIEIDGHNISSERDKYIKEHGYEKIVHFTNEEAMEVIGNPELKLEPPEKPLCKCGCGKKVNHIQNKYIYGHYKPK